MDPHSLATLKLVLAGALAALVAASFALERHRPRRAFDVAFALVLAASALAYLNLGRQRSTGGLVNAWEHFHFFLGSKYLPELRYDGLYDATAAVMADRYHLPRTTIVRDLTTFELRPAHLSAASVEAAKARFSAERWQEFAGDVAFFMHRIELPMERVLKDHGNTGSPAWAALARPLTNPLSAGPRALLALSLLDLALLALLTAAVTTVFSPRVACIAMSIGLLAPNATEFLGGSILRLDWLAALGGAACLLAAGRRRTTAILLAYAIASKPFCILFAVSLAAWHLLRWRRTGEPPRALAELAAWSAVALVAIVALSSALLGGPAIWADYAARIHLNLEELYYPINYSLRDVVLQVAEQGPHALVDWTPDRVAASSAAVQAAHGLALALARAALAALLVFVVARHDDEVFAFGIGAFLVFTCLVTNMYYWQMLLLPAIAFARTCRSDLRTTLYLLLCCAFLAGAYGFRLAGGPPELAGFVGSWMLATICVAMGAVEAAAAARQALNSRS